MSCERSLLDDASAEEGCAYINGDHRPCGKPCRPHSSYCLQHHARTHVEPGSSAERRRIREFWTLARYGGGGGFHTAAPPSAAEISDLERTIAQLAAPAPRPRPRAGKQ